jgi:type III restriction enzyme
VPAPGGIDHLIINSPFEEPTAFWEYERERQRFVRREGRREAGYVMASTDKESVDDPGVFVPLPLVNQIRPRVAAWRVADYPGVTGVTKRLLAHWRDADARQNRFFFCQLEAIETLIWLAEAPAADRQGIELPGDGGLFPRVCAKMATGSGKTVVMAMAIAWHVLNKVESPQDRRFAKYVLVVAPGLTVKSRLAVLEPSHAENYYAAFEIVPPALMDRLRQGRVLVRNWHALAWDSPERIAKRRSVDKRGAKSDEAYVRGVLGELASAKHLLVINDEAHHAWRGEAKGVSKADVEEATVWVGGLDRIHRARGILAAYDFSATPFVPSGKKSSDEALFGWIASDFGLSDAIEAGLVKTPRVVIRDDGVPNAKTYKSDLFHIFRAKGVAADLNRPAQPSEPLPDLVLGAYYLLGKDWLVTQQAWKAAGAATPPVMITVANRTETAARIHATFEKKRVAIPELCEPEGLLHIDSKVLELAEEEEAAAPAAAPAPSGEDEEDGEAPVRKLTKQEQAELLRRTVDTVGRVGAPGERIQNVISVGMLSEGWDAKTVTHIMGLRAFTSQLLCEQVVGRGLRRTSYDVDPATGLFEPEFVNIFGVPFTFLPHEVEGTTKAEPPKPRTRIEPLPDKKEYEIAWPNVLRIDHGYANRLVLDLEKLPVLRLHSHETPMRAEIAPTVAGKFDLSRLSPIELESLGQRFRMQTIAFQTAAQVFDQMAPGWPGGREALLGQLVALVERVLRSDRVQIEPQAYDRDPLRRRILLTLNMSKIVQHVFSAVRHENTALRTLVLDRERPLRATGDMPAWYTTKPCAPAMHSHISACVFDSTWEAHAAQKLDHDPRVAAWVKNDHLGFEVHYLFQGAPRRYRPDFLARLSDGSTLILEVKGQDSQQEEAKRAALGEWIAAVDEHGGFGRWSWGVAFNPSEYEDILERAQSGR